MLHFLHNERPKCFLRTLHLLFVAIDDCTNIFACQLDIATNAVITGLRLKLEENDSPVQKPSLQKVVRFEFPSISAQVQ
jgi:hypothetical protein